MNPKQNPKQRKTLLDDGWPESVEEQGLLLLVLRHYITKRYIKNVLQADEKNRIKTIYYIYYKYKTLVCIVSFFWFFTHGTVYTLTFCTQKFLHTDVFTHRDFYTQTFLHTDAFTHRSFYTQKVYTQTLLHTEVFTHEYFYTQTLLHTNTFTHRRFYTQTLLHANIFTYRRFYTQTLLHTDVFTQIFLHTEVFTRTLYTHKSEERRRACYSLVRHTVGESFIEVDADDQQKEIELLCEILSRSRQRQTKKN